MLLKSTSKKTNIYDPSIIHLKLFSGSEHCSVPAKSSLPPQSKTPSDPWHLRCSNRGIHRAYVLPTSQSHSPNRSWLMYSLALHLHRCPSTITVKLIPPMAYETLYDVALHYCSGLFSGPSPHHSSYPKHIPVLGLQNPLLPLVCLVGPLTSCTVSA